MVVLRTEFANTDIPRAAHKDPLLAKFQVAVVRYPVAPCAPI